MKKELMLLLFLFCLFSNKASSQKVTLTITTVSDCKPLNVKASASISGFKDPIEKYEWDFGDEIITTVDNKIDYMYTTAGTKNISVTVYAGSVVRASAPQVLTVQDLCIEDGTKKGGNGGFSFTHGECGASFTVQFNDDYSTTRANNSVVTEWDFGDGTILSGTAAKTTVSHTYTTNETSIYFVTVKRKDKTTGQPLASGTKRIILVNELAKFKVKNDLSDELCTETRVSFLNDGMNGLGIKKFEWDFGDDKKYTVNNTDFDPAEDGATSHQYNAAGSFPVMLKITDRAGCINTFTFPQNIRIKGPKADFSNSKNIGCGDQFSIAFTDLSTPGIRAPLADWKWYVDNTIVNSYATSESSRIAELSFSNSSIYKKYSIKLIVRDTDGCPSTLSKTNLIEGSNPKATFNSDESNACAPVTLHFTNTSQVNNSNTNYVWTFGQADSTSTSKDAIFSYAHGGSYKASLTITDSYGCTDEKIVPIRISGPHGQVTISDSVGCAPFTFKSQITGENIDHINWNWADGTNLRSTDLSSAHLYIIPGMFTPTATLYDLQGCSFSPELKPTIIVDTLNAGFLIDKTVFCGSGIAGITDISSVWEKSNIAEYNWDFGDGSHSTLPSPNTHNYSEPGEYNLKLAIKSKHGCVSISENKTVRVFNAPSVSISGNDVVCLQPTVSSLSYTSFTKSIDPISDYLWQIDDTTKSDKQNLNIDFRESGAHTIKLFVATNNGCRDTVIKQIIIDSVIANFSVLDSINCGENKTVRFESTTSSAYPIISYLWQYGDSTTSRKAAEQHGYTAAGNYPVALTVTTENNCVAQIRKEHAVVIYNKPSITFDAGKEKCFGESFNYFSKVDSDDRIIDQQLHIYTHEGKITQPPLTVGTYNLAYTVETAHGCKDSATQSFSIRPLPELSLSKDTTICKGNTIGLFSSGANTYSWTTDGSTFIQNANTSNAIINPDANARYFVHSTNEYGCSKDSSVFVKVATPVGLSVSPPVSICEGDHVRLWAKGNAVNFIWSNANSLNNDQSANPIASPQESTTYLVTALSGNVCSDEMDSVSVTVTKKPIVSFDGDITAVMGSVITLQPMLSSNIYSYNWQPSTGLSCSDCANPRLTINADRTYTFQVRTKEGCIASHDINIRVLDQENKIYIPNAFTPNGDGINDVFYIRGNGIQLIKTFCVFDRWGKMVFKKENCNANDRSAGWNGLVNGMPLSQSTTFIYVADIIDTKGKSQQLKGSVLLVR